MSKYLVHVPTLQFGFISVELEGTEAEAVEAHNSILKAYNGGIGLSTKDYNQALDRYLNDGTGDTETYHQMNLEQRRVFQEIKKSLARNESKLEEEEDWGGGPGKGENGDYSNMN